MAAEEEITTNQWKFMKDIYNKEGLRDNPLGCIFRIDPVKFFQESCARKCPHITRLHFLLSGSKKEGGSEARLFSGKKPILNETDVMLTLEGQILHAEDEDLLICTPEHPGFVFLKNPGQQWLDAFAAEIENDVPMVIEEGGITFVSTYFCRQWIEKLVKNLGFDAQGPVHSHNINMLHDVLPVFQRFLTSSKSTDPTAVDLMSQIVEEMDKCSLAIDDCQAVASCGVNICLNQNTGDLTQDKILVYDKENEKIPVFDRGDTKEYLMCLLKKKMITMSSLIKKCTQIEQFDFIVPSFEISHYFSGEFVNILKFFTDMKSSVEHFILWKIWQNLKVQDLIVGTECAINSEHAPIAEADFVYSVKCAFWPEIAKPWIVRERPFDVPSLELCQEIASHGVHLVCKNYPSGDERLNWRLSFSEAEIKLVSMRSKKQKLVYFIFKSIFYEQLKSVYDEPTDTSLSSYHVKTIMLWACEKRALEFWERNCHLACLEALFTDLEVALRTKKLPNYFIPEMNLLADCESILDRALDVVTRIQRDIESYPSLSKIEELIEVMKTSEKLAESTFELHQQMPYLQRTGQFDLELFTSIGNMFHGPMDNMFPINFVSCMSEILSGKTIVFPTSRSVPEHVFGIDETGLQSLVRFVTGCTFGNSTFFEEVVDDLWKLRRDDSLRSLVYRMLLVDVELQIKLNDEVLEELKLKGSIALELQKWFL